MRKHFFYKIINKKHFCNVFIKVIKKMCKNILFSAKYLIKTVSQHLSKKNVAKCFFYQIFNIKYFRNVY
jgi:hypothetical protein